MKCIRGEHECLKAPTGKDKRVTTKQPEGNTYDLAHEWACYHYDRKFYVTAHIILRLYSSDLQSWLSIVA